MNFDLAVRIVGVTLTLAIGVVFTATGISVEAGVLFLGIGVGYILTGGLRP